MEMSMNPNARNFSIGILSTTAAILFVGLLLLQNQSPTAYGEGMTTSSANYVLTVGRLSQGDEELLYLIDTASDKLIAYRFEATRKQIEIVQGIDLGELRRATTPASTPSQPNKPGQRPGQP